MLLGPSFLLFFYPVGDFLYNSAQADRIIYQNVYLIAKIALPQAVYYT